MGFNSSTGAIEELFFNNFLTLPIEADNVKLKVKPASGWVRLTIFNDSQKQQGFNGANNEYRKSGLVIINIFTPQGAGTSTGDKIADTIEGFMRGVTFKGVKFYAPTLENVGNSGDWFQQNFTIPFFYNEIA